ncbi:MAG: hypothetical protein HY554_15730, partial [Elusimicrobia bacterium]|nr:hypothetical protein [Elusimicrobiota bacterium]
MSRLAALRPGDWAPLLGGGDYAEAYLEESWGMTLQFEDSRIEEIASGSDFGVGLRVLRRVPGTDAFETRHGSLNRFDARAAAELSRRLSGSAADGRRAKPLPAPSRASHPAAIRPEDVPLERKTRMLDAVDRAIRAEFPEVRQLSLTYGERRKAFLILNSEGEARHEERVSTLFVADATAERDGVLQT